MYIQLPALTVFWCGATLTELCSPPVTVFWKRRLLTLRSVHLNETTTHCYVSLVPFYAFSRVTSRFCEIKCRGFKFIFNRSQKFEVTDMPVQSSHLATPTFHAPLSLNVRSLASIIHEATINIIRCLPVGSSSTF